MRGEPPVTELAFEFVAEHTKSGAAVEDVNLVSNAHFYAGGVASIAHVLGLWSGRGTAYAPKLHSHVSSTPAQVPELSPKILILLGILSILPVGYSPTSD